ncbi:MAG: Nicotinamide-nucleotide amidohydrolase PncC [Chlamydiia bacterium]|nr:Nicotinamide-nucleotide amidohydrolase PncC [Chlamydiia bacterium]
MKIEILSIGNEILSGATIDTNFVYLASRLLEEGYQVAFHEVIPDDPKIMKEVFQRALNRSSIVITTGGLGPTIDDRTRDVTADVFEKKLVLSEEVKEYLIKRYGKGLSTIEIQSMVPEDTKLLKNEVGVAPGFFYEGKSSMFVFPGVPSEMKAMFENFALKEILELLSNEKKMYSKSMYLCHVSEHMVDPYLRDLERAYPDVEKGIYPGYGVLSIGFKVKESSEKKATGILDNCIDAIAEKFYTHVYSTEEKDIALAVHTHMTKHGLTLATAESCTGGNIAAKITEISGASNYFLGSIVSYSNHMKESVLKVRKQTLDAFGAVSEEVVKEMLEGAMQASGADYVMAVSGVAGPTGGTPQKPVGLVYCGLMKKGEEPHVAKILAKGAAKRHLVIEYTTNFMLGTLYRKVVYDITPFSNVKTSIPVSR